ncbi:copper resistance protein [Cupriavidus basilensis]|uniref:copper resistance protein n=1 Tax=Cupriavidus basilensis TaxID=68895 RepID=UPI0023E8D44E|nr:copper resistance protein [Cupriavidus basilensis]MDF3885088.1 copper resistance protein [Cupriavidus basilensis]
MRTSLRRLWLAGLLITAFLTVQLAAAAYACTGSRYSLEQMDDMAGMMESCPEMAKNAPPDAGAHDGLCLEHCQLGSKSVDHASPLVPAFLPVLLNVIEPTPAPTVDHFALVYGNAIPRAPPPRLSILHCCYRT